MCKALTSNNRCTAIIGLRLLQPLAFLDGRQESPTISPSSSTQFGTLAWRRGWRGWSRCWRGWWWRWRGRHLPILEQSLNERLLKWWKRKKWKCQSALLPVINSQVWTYHNVVCKCIHACMHTHTQYTHATVIRSSILIILKQKAAAQSKMHSVSQKMTRIE